MGTPEGANVQVERPWRPRNASKQGGARRRRGPLQRRVRTEHSRARPAVLRAPPADPPGAASRDAPSGEIRSHRLKSTGHAARDLASGADAANPPARSRTESAARSAPAPPPITGDRQDPAAPGNAPPPATRATSSVLAPLPIAGTQPRCLTPQRGRSACPTADLTLAPLPITNRQPAGRQPRPRTAQTARPTPPTAPSLPNTATNRRDTAHSRRCPSITPTSTSRCLTRQPPPAASRPADATREHVRSALHTPTR
jgi:hypothetical protein